MSLLPLPLHQISFHVCRRIGNIVSKTLIDSDLGRGLQSSFRASLVWCTFGSLVSCIPSGNLGYNYRINDTDNVSSDSVTAGQDEEGEVESKETDSDTESNVETEGNESEEDVECDVSSEDKDCEKCMRANCCDAFLENPCLFGDCPCKDACREGDPQDLDSCLIECELGGDTNCIVEHCSEECNQQQSMMR